MSNSGRILALRLLPVRCYRKFWSRRATKCVASLAFLFCIVVVIPRSDPRLYQQMRKSVPRDQINPSSTVESIRSDTGGAYFKSRRNKISGATKVPQEPTGKH
uniref:Uncharacterized protein n=1 Tax=Ciona savignyi TaxID=51511 RepID=H2YQS3_CIOSA